MYKYGSSFHLTYCALLGYPFLDALVEDRINLSGIVDDKIVPASGKIELLSRILPKFFATDYRVFHLVQWMVPSILVLVSYL